MVDGVSGPSPLPTPTLRAPAAPDTTPTAPAAAPAGPKMATGGLALSSGRSSSLGLPPAAPPAAPAAAAAPAVSSADAQALAAHVASTADRASQTCQTLLTQAKAEKAANGSVSPETMTKLKAAAATLPALKAATSEADVAAVDKQLDSLQPAAAAAPASSADAQATAAHLASTTNRASETCQTLLTQAKAEKAANGTVSPETMTKLKAAAATLPALKAAQSDADIAAVDKTLDGLQGK